jgi:hypothetical protein
MGHCHPGRPNAVERRFDIGINQEKHQSDSQGHHDRKQNQIPQMFGPEQIAPKVVSPLKRILTFG